MNKRIIAIAGIVLILVACSKDNYQTRPSITLKSLSSNFVPAQSDFNVELEYTDKEGDIQGATIQIIKIRNNIWKTPTVRDTVSLLTSTEVPDKSKGIIELRLTYQNYLISANNPVGPGSIVQNDSLTMKFILKDKASNASDTLVVKDIVIERK